MKSWRAISGHNADGEHYHSHVLVDDEHRVWAEIITNQEGFCECEFQCDAGIQERLYLDLDSAKSYCERALENAAESEMLREAQRAEFMKKTL
jgi:hypothetical protein